MLLSVKISFHVFLSLLKDQSGERTDPSGGGEEVGESSTARRGQAEAGGEGAADSGATQA